MGLIVFLIVAIAEISFAFFCILTKSNQEKTKKVIRLTTLSVFLFLIVGSFIDWGFRYYGLVLIVTLLSIFSFVSAFRNKEPKKEYRPIKTVLKTIGVLLLLFISSLPAILFPQNIVSLNTTGRYKVLTNISTYIDSNRIENYSDAIDYRKLNIQFWYPDRFDQTYPLVVFSHGGLGVKSSNESLYNELASHGYVVLSIDHTYQSFFTTDEMAKTTWIDLKYMQQMLSENPLKDMQQSLDYYKMWMKTRMDDINFVIDTVILNSENNNEEGPYKFIDVTKMGVMGHSLGGSAALGIGRVRDDVSAIVALESPFLYDIEGIDNDGFFFNNEVYPLPVLNIYSDSSWTILDKRPQYATNHALLTDTNQNIFNAYIEGIGHLSLTDFSLTSPILTRLIDRQESTISPEEALRRINELCLNFFNRYLKDEV